MPATTTAVFRSPLHHWHVAHGQGVIDDHRWQVPTASTKPAPIDADRGLALVDLSHGAKIRFLGKGVGAIAEALAPAGTILRPGQARCRAGVDSALLCRLRDDHLLALSSTTHDADLEARLASIPLPDDVSRWDATTALASVRLVGPRLHETVARLTQLDVTTVLTVGACVETNFAGVPALLVGEPGSTSASLRICVGWDLAEYVWERLNGR